jgi:hypothetical protein
LGAAAVVVVAAATWLSLLRLVMHLLMMGLLGSLVLMALMVQRRKVGIVTGNDVAATEASGSGVGTGTATGIASTRGGSGVVSGAGMRPEAEVEAAAVARTTGWRGWVVMAEICTWNLRAVTGTSLQRTGI